MSKRKVSIVALPRVSEDDDVETPNPTPKAVKKVTPISMEKSGNFDPSLVYMHIDAFSLATSSGKDETFVVYHLRVGSLVPEKKPFMRWTIYRRYAEFDALRRALASDGIITKPLPPKRLFNKFHFDFLTQRMAGLHQWMLDLGPEPLHHEATKVFFTKLANKPPLEILDMRKNQSEEKSALAHQGTTNVEARLDAYDLLCQLGKGAFGSVYLVIEKKSKKKYALKMLQKSTQRQQIARLWIERDVLAVLRSPFVVRLHQAFQSRTKLFFVLDFCAGGELYNLIADHAPFPEPTAVFYAAECLAGLHYLHERGILYRDLKPENVLLSQDGHCKLADFGLAKMGIDSTNSGGFSCCGTPEYLAPEVLTGPHYGLAIDLWSYGILLFEMLIGWPPFFAENRKALFHKIKHAPLEIPREPSISRDAVVLTSNLLCREPTHRPTTKKTFDFAFFSSINWDALQNLELKPPFRPAENIMQNFAVQQVQPAFEEDESPETIALLNDRFRDFSFTKKESWSVTPRGPSSCRAGPALDLVSFQYARSDTGGDIVSSPPVPPQQQQSSSL